MDGIEGLLQKQYARAKIYLRLSAQEGQVLLGPYVTSWNSWGWLVRRLDVEPEHLDRAGWALLSGAEKLSCAENREVHKVSLFCFFAQEKASGLPYYWFCLKSSEGGLASEYYFAHWDHKHPDHYLDRNTIRYMIYREILGLDMPMPCLQPSQCFVSSTAVNSLLASHAREHMGEWPHVWVNGTLLDRQLGVQAMPVGWRSADQEPISYFYLPDERVNMSPDPRFPGVREVLEHKMQTRSRFRALLRIEERSAIRGPMAFVCYLE